MARAALLTLALLASGCYALTIGQEPKPVAPGKVRATTGMGWNLERPAPYLHVGLRVGVAQRTEARLKLSLLNRFSLEAGVNVEAVERARWSLFLMPHYRYFSELAEDEFSWRDQQDRVLFRRIQALAVPTLFVVRAWGQEMFAGPDLHVGRRRGAGFLALGGHLGLSFHLGKHVSLTPELALLVVTAGKRDVVHVEDRVISELAERVLFAPGSVMGEAGLSISFGGVHGR